MIKEKIKTREELIEICNKLREKKQKIGFTSGVFDIFHAGHAQYLEFAKKLCDVLIVGINSDESTKKYKGSDRPIVEQKFRQIGIAALESVDYVFIFDERRNKKNIDLLRPDYYIKANDYRPEELTSKKEVEKYGGKIEIIPLVQGISTSKIMQRFGEIVVTDRFVEKDGAVHMRVQSTKQYPAVFLDRDGTINEEIGYLHDPEKLRFLPKAIEGIKKFYDMRYRIIIITNQPGIGIGYYSEEDFYRVNRAMLSAFSGAGILVDKIYFCPHSLSEQCDCRKPNQALIERAKEELNLDLSHSYFIGDRTTDMETGRRAGMKTILVKTGARGEDGEFPGEPDYWADDLLEAAGIVLEEERG